MRLHNFFLPSFFSFYCYNLKRVSVWPENVRHSSVLSVCLPFFIGCSFSLPFVFILRKKIDFPLQMTFYIYYGIECNVFFCPWRLSRRHHHHHGFWWYFLCPLLVFSITAVQCRFDTLYVAFQVFILHFLPSSSQSYSLDKSLWLNAELTKLLVGKDLTL